MRQYEVTFIVGPVLPKNEVEGKAKKYTDFLKKNNCEIVNVDEMGLRQLAYPIKKFNSGYYYCIEFKSENGKVINPLELEMRRDEELLRFLTVHLDKYGIKYNEDKRNGKIGVARKIPKKDGTEGGRGRGRSTPPEKPSAKPVEKAVDPTIATVPPKPTPTEAPKPEPKPEPKPAAAAPKAEEAKPAQKDDLKKIEGIGPKIASLLNDAGIMTFAQLANTEPDKVKEILANAGSRFTMHNPATWGQQALLASQGKWDELKKWQDELDGGKVAKSSSEEE